MRSIVGILALGLALFAVSVAFAGTNYNCPFPVSIKLDGNLSDWAGTGAEFILVPSNKGTGPAPNDVDASFKFAAAANDNWLYVAIEVKDDIVKYGETDDWQDDSVEIYIDANHARTSTYENDDVQITIGAKNIDLKNIEKPALTGSSGVADTETQAAVVKSADGWIVEAGIPLKNKKWDIKPADGLVIGFNVHFNDDDDGGGRDHKLIWSDLDTDDASWNNPTRFADLTFVLASVTAVRPSDKLSTTWGNLKQ